MVLANVANAALDNCLYCRYVDLRATMLESWSYCPYSQECLEDQWNYIDRPCPEGGWSRGSDNTLFTCESEEVLCPPPFIASKQYDLNEELGKALNVSFSLISGAQCEVIVNATEYVGRVIFDDVQGYLGIEQYDPEYDVKERISFENEVGKIRIYNA